VLSPTLLAPRRRSDPDEVEVIEWAIRLAALYSLSAA
jgi:hypothetical protein